ncbi:MAG: flagellar motor switch protein FliM, partial [Planctomycetes bacterium]|nr:flagellar motor switch protein FliM [Planctomycetota bacterium]
AESAARAIGATTSEKLRLEVVCDCVAVEQMRFGSWLSQLLDPVAIFVLRLPPFEHNALLSISTSMLYSAVDRILGGTGNVKDVPPDLTAAEYTVADAFVGPCLDHICRSLESIGDISWEVEQRLSNPSAAQILGSHEVAVSLYFQVSGKSLHGDMRLVIPHASLEPHIAGLAKSRVAAFNLAPGEMRDVVASTINEVNLNMTVQLGEASLAIRDLMELAVGDVVTLNKRAGDPLLAPVQGIPKFRGTVGRRGRRLAYQVQSVIE